MENNDFFCNANVFLRSLPEEIHLITWVFLLILVAHLLYGAYIERKKLKTHVRWYLKIRSFLMLSYLCIKGVDFRYGMFDFFLPFFILLYIDGLIIIKGYMFHRCEGFLHAFKRLTKFTSKKK